MTYLAYNTCMLPTSNTFISNSKTDRHIEELTFLSLSGILSTKDRTNIFGHSKLQKYIRKQTLQIQFNSSNQVAGCTGGEEALVLPTHYIKW